MNSEYLVWTHTRPLHSKHRYTQDNPRAQNQNLIYLGQIFLSHNAIFDKNSQKYSFKIILAYELHNNKLTDTLQHAL